MSFSTEEDAQRAIETWRQEPEKTQRKEIRLAIESLELSQMYYEQKGNDLGCARSGRCIALLRARLAELAAE
ncbi:MAG: hypothetical protein AB1413_07100 [Thermodesulfobacteriota bacterium]|jgi:hypothetical protein